MQLDEPKNVVVGSTRRPPTDLLTITPAEGEKDFHLFFNCLFSTCLFSLPEPARCWHICDPDSEVGWNYPSYLQTMSRGIFIRESKSTLWRFRISCKFFPPFFYVGDSTTNWNAEKSSFFSYAFYLNKVWHEPTSRPTDSLGWKPDQDVFLAAFAIYHPKSRLLRLIANLF